MFLCVYVCVEKGGYTNPSPYGRAARQRAMGRLCRQSSRESQTSSTPSHTTSTFAAANTNSPFTAANFATTNSLPLQETPLLLKQTRNAHSSFAEANAPALPHTIVCVF